MGIDFEVVDDGVHGKGEGILEFALGLEHDAVDEAEGFLFSVGVDDEAHSSTGHAAEHPEAPEVVAEFFLDS